MASDHYDDDDDEEEDDEDAMEGVDMLIRSQQIHHDSQERPNRLLLFVSLSLNVAFLFILLIVVAVAVILTPSTSSILHPSNSSSNKNNDYNNTHSSSPPPTSPQCTSNEQWLQQKYFLTNVSRGMVASDQAVCSHMATELILQQHQQQQPGTAVDAAVFVALCLGVVNPASSGLGGGAFILLHHTPNNHNNNNANQSLYYDARTTNTTPPSSTHHQEVIDCRERAPERAHTTMYSDYPSNASVVGALAIPVMGELHCLAVAHDRYGQLPWSQIVQPVADLARRGVIVGSYLARQIHDTAAHHVRLIPTPEESIYDSLRQLLTHDNDWSRPLQEGDVLRNLELAATLDRIAQDGVAALYHPPISSTLVEELQQHGGILTTDDYRNYRPTIHTPITSQESVQGFTIMGVPPPSSGGAAVIGALRFLVNFSIPFASLPDTVTIHRIVEACQHVFAMRMSLSDPDYNTATVQNVVHDLVASSYMDQLRKEYYNETTTLSSLALYGGRKWSLLNDTESFRHQNVTDAKEGDRILSVQQKQQQRQKVHKDRQYHRSTQRTFGYLNDHGTSHFSIVDQYGNAVAMTTSVNTNFGSHVRSPSTGILFSNTMDDFSKPDRPNHYGLKPSVSNFIQPMKRPLSSMSPTMVFRHGDNPRANDGLGDLVLVIGASGGPKIITAVLQVLIRIIYMGQHVFDAVLHPRIHNQLIYHNGAITATEKAKIVTTKKQTNPEQEDDDSSIEYDINVIQRTRDALLRRNHQLIDIDFSGTVQAISLDYEGSDGDQGRPILSGVSDPRKDGAPAGY